MSDKIKRFDYKGSLYTALRAAVNAIPIVGGSIDAVLSELVGRNSEKRMLSLIEELEKEFEQLHEEVINKEFIKSDEWTDLIRLSVEKTIRIRNENKIRAIAKIITDSAKKDKLEVDHAEDLIDILGELREEEAKVLSLIYSKKLEGIDITSNGIEIKDELPENMVNRLHFILKRLEGLGLISEFTGSMFGYSGGSFSLTKTGVELCEYIFKKEDDLWILYC